MKLEPCLWADNARCENDECGQGTLTLRHRCSETLEELDERLEIQAIQQLPYDFKKRKSTAPSILTGKGLLLVGWSRSEQLIHQACLLDPHIHVADRPRLDVCGHQLPLVARHERSIVVPSQRLAH